MIISRLFFSLVSCTILFGTINNTVTASSHTFEDNYLEIGYTNVEEAKSEFEQHFRKELNLPLRVPAIEFTHYFGRFNNLEGNISFEIEAVNENKSENHYMVEIRPIKHKVPFREKHIAKTLKLKNGQKADYIVVSGIRALVFEKDGWQYRLSIDRRLMNKVIPEVLVEIANSIDYPTS
ncbi:hypothetical protein FZW96_21585 [Bacillus sp. BGMRC 2118]|nr:hypothetical protein FZW96_21585 [Bacillus sp. BGMRC 2118]